MTIITATFKGPNGTNGYETGMNYGLEFKQIEDTSKVTVTKRGDSNLKSLVIYDNVFDFFENWTDIKT